MGLILAFDTSGPYCAVALLWPTRHLTRFEPMAKGQAERLLPMIQEMMAEEALDWPDIARIHVGTGPGNFTGIRIAVALARGLALGLNVPALGVTGFQARAQIVAETDFWVTIPAPRDQIYVQRSSHAATVMDRADFDSLGAPVFDLTDLAPDALALAIAQTTGDGPRPAPFYLRAADALPSSDPPPVILP